MTEKGGDEKNRFSLADVVLGVLFSAGIVVLFWALIEEARTGAPFYMKLTGVAAGLTISSTFIAAMRRK